MKEIASAQNEQFKYWKSLTKSKGLKEGKHFLLSGSKLIQEVLKDPHWNKQIEFILINKGETFASPDIHESTKITILSQSLFAEVNVLGTKSPIFVMKQPLISSWNAQASPEGLELLCPFGDPQNLGALIRTAYAFGANKVVLLKEAAHPLLPKSIKASSGAVLKIPLLMGPSINEIGAPAVALDLNGTALSTKAWPKNLRLLLGEEGMGIPAGFNGEKITLPMANPMESLNAAVAAGIAIYTLTQH